MTDEEQQALWAKMDRDEVESLERDNMAARRKLRKAAGQKSLQLLEMIVAALERNDVAAIPGLLAKARQIVDGAKTERDRLDPWRVGQSE